MTVFGDYAKFYDTLYEDKDYVAECDFLQQIFSRFSDGKVRSILDLGCGTGGHALILGDRGYEVTGVDRSEVMLETAKAKDDQHKIHWHLADIREFEIDQKFDAVISMFAVMSYMTTNDDLMAAFATASRHLKPGGLFIFDSWFGPAVFIDPPTDRVKDIRQEKQRVIRFTHPKLDHVSQTVTVNFTVLSMDENIVLEEVFEPHTMRPFFVQEIALLGALHDLSLVHCCPFMDIDSLLSAQDWNSTFILRKVLS